MNKSNLSSNSNEQNIKINHYISFSQIKRGSPSKKLQKKLPKNQIHKSGKVKLIPYLTQDYQISKEDQRKTKESYKRGKTINKESKNTLKEVSPLTSPNRIKHLMNINNINTKLITSFPISNLENLNCNSEILMDKINQPSFSKISQKNIYISIKHNKTNLCKEELNNNGRKSKKPLNKLKVNKSKKEIKKIDNNELNIEREKSPKGCSMEL